MQRIRFKFCIQLSNLIMESLYEFQISYGDEHKNYLIHALLMAKKK